jgi:hypothetical protein
MFGASTNDVPDKRTRIYAASVGNSIRMLDEDVEYDYRSNPLQIAIHPALKGVILSNWL